MSTVMHYSKTYGRLSVNNCTDDSSSDEAMFIFSCYATNVPLYREILFLFLQLAPRQQRHRRPKQLFSKLQAERKLCHTNISFNVAHSAGHFWATNNRNWSIIIKMLWRFSFNAIANR